MSGILGIIPARYASTRLPAKPLVDIEGMSMIERVYRQSCLSTRLTEVWVATDDVRILEKVESFGGKAILTSLDHPSGTDRCAEAAKLIGGDPEFVINIQGDEPFIDPQQLDELAELLLKPGVQIGTLVRETTDFEEIFGWKEAKTVFTSDMRALYFSRSPIPHIKGKPQEAWIQHASYYKHIGLYGFRADVLQQLQVMPPTELEMQESLEMLRWMDTYSIHIALSQYDSFSVDTEEDVAVACQIAKSKRS